MSNFEIPLHKYRIGLSNEFIEFGQSDIPAFSDYFLAIHINQYCRDCKYRSLP